MVIKKHNIDFHIENYFQKEIEKHFKCVELLGAKKIFEKAIENGQKVPCPGCGLAGKKTEF